MTQPRRYIGPMTDSRLWEHFEPREDDIFVCTPPKSGTTLMQTMLNLLTTGSTEVSDGLHDISPWFDGRNGNLDEKMTTLKAQTSRRVIKTHTPLDGLPDWGMGSFVTVYRHPLDVFFSMENHVHNMPMDVLDWFFPEDTVEGFKRFLGGADEGYDCDATPLAFILHHYQSSLAAKDNRDVHLLHYADLVTDRIGALNTLCDSLGIEQNTLDLDGMAKTVTFKNMKANAEKFAPAGGKEFWQSDARFFNTGTSGKWQGQLDDTELAAYSAAIDASLSTVDRQWLEFGYVGR